MEFEPHDIRPMPVSELVIQKNYLEMVPRPSPEDYNRIRESMEKDGWDPSRPAVANEDGIVLDGMTRTMIAQELKIEWAWVTIKDFDDDLYEEKKYVITANLDRRHLTEAHRTALGLRLLEIEQEKAKERQRKAGELVGKNNLKHQEIPQDKKGDSNGNQLPQNFAEADKGEARELAARQVGVSRETLRKGQKIEAAAITDPKIAEAWDKAQKGKGSVNSVFREVKEKEKASQKGTPEKKAPPERQPIKHLPPEEIMKWLYMVADHQGVTREEMDGTIKMHHDVVSLWDLALRDMLDLNIAWYLTSEWVEEWRKDQRASQPEEIPVPETARKLGPWALDFVHQAGLQDLIRGFPEESVHMVYSEVVADLEQVGLLGEFAGRVLKKGKYLCIYVNKCCLPEAMARLSANGLIYSWVCVAFRPGDKLEVPGRMIREKSRLLLIYRQAGVQDAEWGWIEDSVESRHPTNRDLARQVLNGLTTKDQLVVDPFVGSGITAKVALSLGRRFLCFAAEEEDVRAANQRLKQLRLADSTN